MIQIVRTFSIILTRLRSVLLCPANVGPGIDGGASEGPAVLLSGKERRGVTDHRP